MARPQNAGERPVFGSAHFCSRLSSQPWYSRPVLSSRACFSISTNCLITSSNSAGSSNDLRVLREERRAHVQAVEPHLIRVPLLVPEAAFLGARMLAHLLAQELDGLAVLFVLRLRVEQEQRLAGVDAVDVVLVLVVRADRAVGLDNAVVIGLDVFPVALVAGALRRRRSMALRTRPGVYSQRGASRASSQSGSGVRFMTESAMRADQAAATAAVWLRSRRRAPRAPAPRAAASSATTAPKSALPSSLRCVLSACRRSSAVRAPERVERSAAMLFACRSISGTFLLARDLRAWPAA